MAVRPNLVKGFRLMLRNCANTWHGVIEFKGFLVSGFRACSLGLPL